VWVRDVAFERDRVVVTVALRRQRLACPECEHSTAARYDTRPVPSTWRHLDLGSWRLEVRAELRRLVCPTHGVRTEGVGFARAGSRFTVPARFGCLEDARTFCATFFAYYNHEHRHSGIGLHTAASVHYGTAKPTYRRNPELLSQRP
jgi:transposase